MPQLSFHSPFGELTLSEEDGHIVSLDEGRGRDQTETPLLLQVRDLMQDYFDGEKVDFSKVPLLLSGTEYQKRVWDVLRAIPHGETCTYSDIAKKLNTHPRAVGNAIGANPILILVPCHRAVGLHNLGGYSGFNGVEDKERLLELERAL